MTCVSTTADDRTASAEARRLGGSLNYVYIMLGLGQLRGAPDWRSMAHFWSCG
jgi:hypothetical protein